MNSKFLVLATAEITNKLNLNETDKQTLINTLYTLLSNFEVTEKEKAPGSFSDMIDSYLKDMEFNNFSPKTIKNRGYILHKLDKFLQKKIEDITVFDLRSYVVHLQENNIKARTINGYIAQIKAFFAWLHEEEYIEKNTGKRVKKIKEPKRIKKPLSTIELEELRNGCKDDLERAMVEFLYSTGMRISEVVSLNVSDLNFEKKNIYIVGKGDKERTVLFSDRTKYYLEKYLKTRIDKNIDSEALFCANRKPYNRLGARAIEKRLKNIKDRQFIKAEVTPHTLRRTMATNMLSAGADITTVQFLLGHVNIATTQLYAQTSFANVQNQYFKCIDL